MIRRGFFRADVERFVRLAAAVLVMSAFMVTFAWGYEHRRQSQIWREVACANRLADVGRRATLLAVDEQTPNACERLAEFGIALRSTGLAVLPMSTDFGRP